MNFSDIPCNRADTTGNEVAYVEQAMRHGHISRYAPYTRRSQAQLWQITASQRALLTTSCTHALEMAALRLDPRPGDKVIVPSFTCLHGKRIHPTVRRGSAPRRCGLRNVNDRLLRLPR